MDLRPDLTPDEAKQEAETQAAQTTSDKGKGETKRIESWGWSNNTETLGQND
ncbi:hypothetical protein [Brevibacillus sp. NRS-1366]|uniref:hypothetical protein n=1 Tax=Brevibacillus sp. NRS-1366 TaxID=3233899 RepID=UPI003D23FC64